MYIDIYSIGILSSELIHKLIKKLKKIQIILHIKQTIYEHMQFVDLPITQFLLGNNKLYKTLCAQYALCNKINHSESYNRINKYFYRIYNYHRYI